METPIYVALSKQSGQLEEMAQVANNLSNVSTTGFRGSHRLFQEYLEDTGKGQNRNRISFVQDMGDYHNLSQGRLMNTSRSTDLALQGEGYFVIDAPSGKYYSRNGSFTIDPTGRLVNGDGNALLQADGRPITVPPNQAFTVGEDGSVSYFNQSTSETVKIGRIAIVKFADGQDLRQSGGSNFLTDQTPLPSQATVKQGMLEQSNVEPVLEITNMISLQRSFEMVNQLVQSEHDRLKQAINKISRSA
ncbi:MAG: flagellar basal-body rod protein FlgF [Candidatus Pacebacteria bacterium]|nr:flagellar basal-body rod protein FlgF [Candidatus Paceibacterota bacterium]